MLNTLLERRARPDIGNLSTECAAFWRKDQFRREGSVPGSVLKKKEVYRYIAFHQYIRNCIGEV